MEGRTWFKLNNLGILMQLLQQQWLRQNMEENLEWVVTNCLINLQMMVKSHVEERKK